MGSYSSKTTDGSDDEGFTTEIVEAVPSDFVLKVKSFSLFSKNNWEKYESREFEAGGYRWKLILYPSGDKTKSAYHIAMYLAITEKSLAVGTSIDVIIWFYAFNQHTGNYLIRKGKAKTFRGMMKSEWGTSRFVSLKVFKDPSNGYLVGDECMFGAGLHVLKDSGVGKSIDLREEAVPYSFTWKIPGFSLLEELFCFSEEFASRGYKWRIKLYPRGLKGTSICIFLCLVDSLPPDQKLHVTYALRLKGGENVFYKELRETASVFSCPNNNIRGFADFMTMEEFGKCVVNDYCVIEPEIEVLTVVADKTSSISQN